MAFLLLQNAARCSFLILLVVLWAKVSLCQTPAYTITPSATRTITSAIPRPLASTTSSTTTTATTEEVTPSATRTADTTTTTTTITSAPPRPLVTTTYSTTTTATTEEDFRCIRLRQELVSFQGTQLAPCPTNASLPSQNTYGSSYLYFDPPNQDGLLEYVNFPFGLYGQQLSFRISVTTEPFLMEQRRPRRRRRRVVPIIYQRDFINVRTSTQDGNYLVEFSPPVFVQAGVPLYVNILTLDDRPFGPLYYEVAEPALYLRCPLTPPLDPLNNATCYEKYDAWTAMENRFIALGCANDPSLAYRTYEVCLRVTDTVPTVSTMPDPPSVALNVNITLTCPIEGAVHSYWSKNDTRGGTLTSPQAPSPILKFVSFSPADQGYYYCMGVGGGMYRDETVTSEPIRLSIKGTTRLVITVGFDETFIDFYPYQLLSSELATTYQAPIRSALDIQSQSDVGGRLYDSIIDDQFAEDFPAIVDTREGSLIIDYVINFNSSAWTNETDLITTLTNVLGDYFGESQPDGNTPSPSSVPEGGVTDLYIPGSLVVSSATSCPESVATGLYGTLTFNRTLLDQTASSVEHCKDYSNNALLPRATRTCRGNLVSPAVWEDPVLNDCFEEENPNDVLRNIAQQTVTAENVTEYSSDLVTVTEDSDSITAEGIIAVAIALQKIVQVQDPSQEVTNNVINIVDNVLDVGIGVYEETNEVGAPTRILDSLEQQITLFQINGSGTNFTVIGQNVGVVALQLTEDSLAAGLALTILSASEDESGLDDDLSENSTMVFFDTDDIPQEMIDASITIPSAVLDFIPSLTANDSIPVSFLIFQTSKLFQSLDQDYEVRRGRRLAVGTRVIAATVEGVDIVGLSAGQEVETAFLELDVTQGGETVDNRSCVFWEKTENGGRWSTEGCRREDRPNIGRIRCLCDHLTSFAVLLDISGDVNLKALDILSIIGCVISIICLIITLVTYIAMKKLRTKQPQQILINLCFALLGLFVVFVAGIDRRYPTGGCVLVGFLIHYFLLASVSWMLVEAVNMYLLFVKVFDASVSRFMLKACIAAWGLPLLVCIVTVAVDSSLYLGDDSYCFVKPGPALYYGVLLIIGLLLIINCVIFVIVVQRLSCRQAVTAHKSKNNGEQSETWRRLQTAVAISALLGITWIFGFLAIGGARVLFNVLFLVFNSLQGLFVFVMFCVRQKDVRLQWADWLSQCHCWQQNSYSLEAKYTVKGRGNKIKFNTASSSGTSPRNQSGGSGLTESTEETKTI